MSIRCSVLGHDTNETTEEVNSEEAEVSGEKVVKRCARCGKTIETVKEKKHVSIAEAEAEYSTDLGPQAASESETALADGGPNAADDELPAEDDDAVFIEAGPSDDTDDEPDPEPDPTEDSPTQNTESQTREPSTSSSSTVGTTTNHHHEIDDDDAVLLDSGTSSTDGTSEQQRSDRDPQRRNSGSPAETESRSPESTTDGSAESSFDSDAFNGEIRPDESDPDQNADGSGEILTAGEDTVPEPTSSSDSDSDTLLACDSCRFRVKADGTPIRRGDICPRCKTGYIELG